MAANLNSNIIFFSKLSKISDNKTETIIDSQVLISIFELTRIQSTELLAELGPWKYSFWYSLES
jgi:hypothetical protein